MGYRHWLGIRDRDGDRDRDRGGKQGPGRAKYFKIFYYLIFLI